MIKLNLKGIKMINENTLAPVLTKEWFNDLERILKEFMTEEEDILQFVHLALKLYIETDIKNMGDMKEYFKIIYRKLVSNYLSKRDAYLAVELMWGYKEINNMLIKIIGRELLDEILMDIFNLPYRVLKEDRDADCVIWIKNCVWVSYKGGEVFYLNKGIPEPRTYEEFNAIKYFLPPSDVRLVF